MRRMLFGLIGVGLALAVSAPAGVGAPAPSTPAAVTATTFLVSGRGWGHGVGMSQYGALGYAQEGWGYDQILGHYYTGAELGPAPVARVRVLVAEAKGAVTVRSSVALPGSGRLRQDLSASRRRSGARAEAARRRERDADRARRPDPVPAGDGATRGRPSLPRSDRGRRHRDQARRGQHRRPRAVSPGRRRTGDAELLAGRGAEGAGGRRTLVCARAPAERQGVRSLRRRPQPGLRRRRGRASAHDGRDPGDERRGAPLGGQADRRALPFDLGRHDARRRGGLREARAVSDRRRRSAQRPLSRAPLGADARGRDHLAQGAQAADSGDGPGAHTRRLGARRHGQRRHRRRDHQGDRSDAPSGRWASFDLGDAAGDALADAPGRAGAVRQAGLARQDERRASRGPRSSSASTVPGSRSPARR